MIYGEIVHGDSSIQFNLIGNQIIKKTAAVQ